MLVSCVNLDQFHHLVYRVRALRFELALLQEEILTLEFDHGTLAEIGRRMITFVRLSGLLGVAVTWREGPETLASSDIRPSDS